MVSDDYNVYRFSRSDLASLFPPEPLIDPTDFSLEAAPGLAFDEDQNLYLADSYGKKVYKMTFNEEGLPSPLSLIAGSGMACEADSLCGDAGPALTGQFTSPYDLDIDSNGVIYVADGKSLRTLTPDNGAYLLNTLTGDRSSDSTSERGAPSGLLEATFSNILSVLLTEDDSGQMIYLSDEDIVNWSKDLVLALEPQKEEVQIAIGPAYWRQDCLVADSLCEAGFSEPAYISPLPLDNDQVLWLVSDIRSHRLRAAIVDGEDATETLTLAGSGNASYYLDGSTLYTTPPAPAQHSRLLLTPAGVAHDPVTHAVYIVEQARNTYPNDIGPLIHCLTYSPTEPTQMDIRTFAGAGTGAGFEEGRRTEVSFNNPSGLALYRPSADEAFLYVSDTGNQVVRRIQLDPTDPCEALNNGEGDGVEAEFRIVAGTIREAGFVNQDGNLATESYLFNPTGLAIDPNGYLFIADTGNNRVRRVDPDGIISTVIGTGSSSSLGETGLANTIPVNRPKSLDLDSYGNLYVTSGNAIRMVLASHSEITTGTEPHTAGGDDAVRTLYRSMDINSIFEDTNCLSGLGVHERDGTTEVHVMDACSGVWFALRPGGEELPD